MSEATTPIKQQDRMQAKNESLLSILHEKNKTIERLQKQLHFQKLQLKYYLGKTFRNSKMLEFSKTCDPSASEDNIPVSLAINRFCVKVGVKSRIVVLYERMCELDGKINGLLHIQERLLRGVVEKICEMVRKEDRLKLQIQIRKIMSKPEYVSVFNNLLNASLGLKKNLDVFRICCDRLLIVEEERNSIAEQVYSLPVEQRTNCNYLIGIQIEKVQLQNRLKEILKDQSVLRKRIEQLNEIEGELKNLQVEYKMANRNCTEHMTDMLRRVNFEALALIAKSNQQREKYTREIVKLKCENQKILKMVEQLKVFVEEKELSKDSVRLDTVYSAGLYQALDQEINQAIQNNEMNKDCRAERFRNECRELSQKLQNAQNENSLLEQELEKVKTEYSEARRRWECELEAVQRERDDYKAQVDDLQAIRAAYANLADSRANMAEEVKRPKGNESRTKDAEERRRIRELERENMKLEKEVAELKEETNKQKSKIRRLSEQILNVNGNGLKVLDIVQLETKDVGSGDVGNENDSLLPKTNSCNIRGVTSELESGVSLEKLQRSHEKVEEQHITKTAEDTKYLLQDSTDSSNEYRCSTLSGSPMESSSGNNDSKESKIISTPETSIISIGGIQFQVPNNNMETTFEISPIKREDKEDNIRDILEKEDRVEDILRIGDNSMVSVKVKYISPKKIQRSSIPTKREESDFKVLEDCSEEALRSRQVVQFKPLDTSQKEEEMKPLKVTYRNPHGYKSTTDSDPATESQSSEVENFGKMYVKEVKMKLKAVTDVGEQEWQYPIAQYGTDGRVKSLGHLR